MRYTATAATSVLLIALCASCSLTHFNTDSDIYAVRRHTWWNYYARGSAYVDDGNFQKARDDFEIALGLRKGARYGNPIDKWKTRTYGVHAIRDYFPHRELGVCLYNLGLFSDAERYLERSMEQTPSGRAAFYLNQTRARLIERARIDPPSIRVAPDSSVYWTRTRTRQLQATIEASGRIADVSINGERRYIELARDEMQLQEEVELTSGTNTLRIRVTDLQGQVAEEAVVWMADWEPPRVTVRDVEKTADGYRIRGLCEDNHAIAYVAVSNRVVYRDQGNESPRKTLPFNITLIEGENFMLKSKDLAGNDLSFEISHQELSRLTAPIDDLPPLLVIDHPGKTITLFNEEYWLDIKAADDSGLLRVTINEHDILGSESKGGLHLRVARRIPLALGTNILSVTAVDRTGNSTNTTLTLIRREPQYLDSKFRLAVVVPPLAGLSNNLAMEERIRRQIEHELAKFPPRFFLLDRGGGWNSLLREHALSITDLSDERLALSLGRILPAEIAIVGRVHKRGKGTTIYASIIDAENGNLLFETDVYTEDASDLKHQSAGLVLKIEQHFPMVVSQILQLAKAKAIIDAGTNDGVRMGARFMLVALPGGKRGIERGEVLFVKESLAEIRIIETDEARSTGKLHPASTYDTLRPGYFAVAR